MTGLDNCCAAVPTGRDPVQAAARMGKLWITVELESAVVVLH